MKKPACNLSVLLLASFALGQLGPVAADPSPAVQPTAPAAAPAASPTPAPSPAPAPVPAPPAAAPSTESITTTIQLPADKHLAATAMLSAMEQKMSAAKAISFVTNVSFSIPTMLGKPASFTCSGTADKSGNYFISIIRQDGSQENVYFDGQKFTVFNSATSRYCVNPAGVDAIGNMRAMMAAALTVFPKDPIAVTELELSMGLPKSFATGHFLDDVSPTLTSKDDTVNGKQTVDLIETMTSPSINMVYSFQVDPTTDLPVASSMNFSMNGGKMAMNLEQTFGMLTLFSSAADLSTYAFTPPTGAKNIASMKLPTDPASPQASNLIAAGKIAPNFTVISASGQPIKLSHFAGKVVVLDFWATWCGPCQVSLPHTDKIAKTFSKRGVVFLPICTWDDKSSFSTWRKAHASMAMSFYFDPAGQDETSSVAAKLYKVDGIPTQYIIGKDGKVISSFVGYDEENDPDENALVKVLDKAIEGS